MLFKKIQSSDLSIETLNVMHSKLQYKQITNYLKVNMLLPKNIELKYIFYTRHNSKLQFIASMNIYHIYHHHVE